MSTPLPIPDLTALALEASTLHAQYRRATAILRVATAAGTGTLDERLVRLMIWAGAALPSQVEHSHATDPVEIIFSGHAWCDQSAKVFMWAAHELYGLPARELAVTHSDKASGHTMTEVYYDGGWHLYDTHAEHFAVYRDESGRVLSYADLAAGNGSAVAERKHWWRGIDGSGKEGFFQPDSKVCYFGRDGCLRDPASDPSEW